MRDGIPDTNPNKKYAKYFDSGNLDRMPMHKWVHAKASEGTIPDAIVDEREGQLYLKVGGAV